MLPLKQQGDNNQDKDKHTVSSQHTGKKRKRKKQTVVYQIVYNNNKQDLTVITCNTTVHQL